MTKEEFLLDTIQHYNSTNRCVDGSCAYSPISFGLEGVSKGCAIGRMLDPLHARLLDLHNLDYGVINAMKDFPEYFPEWMKQMDKTFLSAIQDLHDDEYYWDTKGLSEEGRKKVLSMILDYNLNMTI